MSARSNRSYRSDRGDFNSADAELRTMPRGAADWLHLAAAPTFTVMALLTSMSDAPGVLCMAAGASPLGGMVPMYLLMSTFHLGPWLDLLSRRQPRHRRMH